LPSRSVRGGMIGREPKFTADHDAVVGRAPGVQDIENPAAAARVDEHADRLVVSMMPLIQLAPLDVVEGDASLWTFVSLRP
jgi:hypothetical protein